MRKGAFVLAAALIVGCESTSAPSVTSPSPGPGASSSVAPGTAAPEPSPLPTARPVLKTSAVGAIPALFRYVALDTPLADGVHTRLWLVDLGAKRAPAIAAEWDAPSAPVGGWSASADGRTLLVSAQGTRSRVALSLVRPETGETRLLFEDPAVTVVAATVSPDGSRFAFTKYPAVGGSDLGMWIGRTGGGEPVRLTDPTTVTTVPQMALAWSRDAAWLAFTRDLDVTEVRLIRADGGEEIHAGPGEKVALRSAAPEVLVAQAVGEGSRIYSVDLASGRSTDLVKSEKGQVAQLAWHPAGTAFVYVLSDSASREASRGIWLWRTDVAAPQRLDVGGRVAFAPEWSADGSVLSALAGGDDARIPIVDLITGRQLSVLCRRGGTPPADCV